MTGEVTLRGRVLAIGGLREKTMAALRNGIKTVIVPAENEKDLEEIDQTVRGALQFIPASHVDQVLANALEHPPLAQPAEDAGEAPLAVPGPVPRHPFRERERNADEAQHTKRGVCALRGEGWQTVPGTVCRRSPLQAGPTWASPLLSTAC